MCIFDSGLTKISIGLWVNYRCNNSCPNCYLKNIDNRYVADDLLISKYLFLLDSILAYKRNYSSVRIGFYGAEPLGMPTSFYANAIRFAERRFKNVSFQFWTSLQKIDGYIDIFQRSNVDVIVSFDGIYRGKKYVYQFHKNMDIFRKYYISTGLMTIVNPYLINIGHRRYADILEKYRIGFYSLKLDERIIDKSRFNDFNFAVADEVAKRKILANGVNAESSTLNYDIYADSVLRIFKNKLEDCQFSFPDFKILNSSNNFKSIYEYFYNEKVQEVL